MTVTTIRHTRQDTDNNCHHYSVNNNWRVPDKDKLPESPSDPPKPIDREWLRKLLRRYPNKNTPSDLQEKALVVAPMVDQSELPFRLQCRRYGANLCFTPMIHSRLFVENERYRQKFLCSQLPLLDRPVIAQICGPDPYVVLETALAVAPYVDGIDLNCGCPQQIAKRGMYGAFLLEERELLLSIVKTLVHGLPNTPVSVKVRLLPTGKEESLALYQELVDCGIAMLTVHGRTRLETNYRTGECDWQAIRRTVELFGARIPILANGGIASLQNVRECLKVTGADGVMSSEAILEYPPLFIDETLHLGKRSGPGRLELAREYLELARKYPPEKGGQGSGLKCIRAHIHKFLHAELNEFPEFRTQCVNAEEWEEIDACLKQLSRLREGHDASTEGLAWYNRHRVETKAAVPVAKYSEEEEEEEVSHDEADCGAGFFGSDDDEWDY